VIKDPNFGFNAETEEFGDLVKAGVCEPCMRGNEHF